MLMKCCWFTLPNAKIVKERSGPGGGLETVLTHMTYILLTYSWKWKAGLSDSASTLAPVSRLVSLAR